MVEKVRKKCKSCGKEFPAIKFAPSNPCRFCSHVNYYQWEAGRDEKSQNILKSLSEVSKKVETEPIK